MEYYQNKLTNKSWEILQKLRNNYNFVLIGGWAVWLYTRSLKSKDIDIIIDFAELAKFRQKSTVNKNERLKKYEVQDGEVDIDIYVPYYSKLGLPIQEITKFAQKAEDFTLPIPEILLILKQITAKNRQGTSKGEKDRIDVISLINTDLIDWQQYTELIKKFRLLNLSSDLVNLLKTVYEVDQLNLNRQQVAKLKRKIFKVLK